MHTGIQGIHLYNWFTVMQGGDVAVLTYLFVFADWAAGVTFDDAAGVNFHNIGIE